MRNGKDSGEQNKGKQDGYNKISAFDFFDKGERDEEQCECEQELHRRQPTQP
jgi:hypothetical protein